MYTALSVSTVECECSILLIQLSIQACKTEPSKCLSLFIHSHMSYCFVRVSTCYMSAGGGKDCV